MLVEAFSFYCSAFSFMAGVFLQLTYGRTMEALKNVGRREGLEEYAEIDVGLLSGGFHLGWVFYAFSAAFTAYAFAPKTLTSLTWFFIALQVIVVGAGCLAIRRALVIRGQFS